VVEEKKVSEVDGNLHHGFPDFGLACEQPMGGTESRISKLIR